MADCYSYLSNRVTLLVRACMRRYLSLALFTVVQTSQPVDYLSLDRLIYCLGWYSSQLAFTIFSILFHVNCRYYECWLVCDDPSCGRRTMQQSVKGKTLYSIYIQMKLIVNSRNTTRLHLYIVQYKYTHLYYTYMYFLPNRIRLHGELSRPDGGGVR